MKSFYILRHSVLQILRQPKAVLQIFLLPNATAFFLFKASGLAFVFSPLHTQIAINRGIMPWGLLIGLMLVSISLWLWSALAWHRFILLAEYPRYFWPGVAWGAVRRFAGSSLSVVVMAAILVFCAMVILGFVLGFASAWTKQPPGWFAITVAIAASCPILVAVLRLTLLLPHSAVTGDGGLGRIWTASTGCFWTFFAILACTSAIRFGWNYLLQNQGILPFDSVGFGIIALGELIQSVLMISIITTLYGHYVQGRPLT